MTRLSDGNVYFIRDGLDGPIKIGWSVGDATERLKALQCGNPRRLILQPILLVGDRALEVRVHERFDRWRLNGEWFEPIGELVELSLEPSDRILADLDVLRVIDRRTGGSHRPSPPDSIRRGHLDVLPGGKSEPKGGGLAA